MTKKPRTKIEVYWFKRGRLWEVRVWIAGGWEVWYGCPTKKDAVRKAVEHAKRTMPSSVRIKKKDGRYQEERTYPRSSDPRRSKG